MHRTRLYLVRCILYIAEKEMLWNLDKEYMRTDFSEAEDKHIFNEALGNFTRDFAYGGAIRHLVNRGYTVDMIIKEFNYPLSRETIEKMAMVENQNI